jgi:hypothetical protein
MRKEKKAATSTSSRTTYFDIVVSTTATVQCRYGTAIVPYK